MLRTFSFVTSSILKHNVLQTALLFAGVLFLLLFVSACSNITKPDLPEASLSKPNTVMASPDQSAMQHTLPDTILNIMAVGDMMLGTDYPDYRLPPQDGKALLAGVSDILSQADITFGNLEGTFGTGGVAEKACPDVSRCYVFRMPPRYALHLKEAGFDVMSLANNHARDFGDSGRLLTMQTLDNAGIKHSGLEGDIAQWELKGLKVVLIAFAPFRGAHDFLDLDYVRKTIQSLAQAHDIVIVSFHAGAEGDAYIRVPFETEYFHGENRGDVVLFAHTAIEAGADVILGHGPHVPRALELYQQRIIAYSLGNFCTTLGIKVTGKNGLAPILSINIDQQGRFKSGQIISARQRRPAGPLIDKRHRAARLIRQLTQQDFPDTGLEIDAVGNIMVKAQVKAIPAINRDNIETKSDKSSLDSVK
ncbi:Capsule biosynthesis protein capA [hydrothermal vent metagenome]|uniref:Capsule biosynthesis protein capA n=1 Tax=hydrothermal vent metagenome TaxID=652676 RepID=A0A3B0ZEG9_9ZZZZ